MLCCAYLSTRTCFAPGVIQPLDGIRSKTRSYRILYALFNPLFPLVRRLMPNRVVTTREIGRAMLAVVRKGYPSRVLEPKDILIVARSI
jgi:hypothetical protein